MNVNKPLQLQFQKYPTGETEPMATSSHSHMQAKKSPASFKKEINDNYDATISHGANAVAASDGVDAVKLKE